MRNIIIFCILMFPLTGCLSPYAYHSLSNQDPEFTFGGRPGFDGTRGFNLRVSESPIAECKDFTNIGTIANSSKMFDKNKKIRTPEGKVVTIRGILGFTGVMCNPKAMMFKPESGHMYSVDIGTVGNKCFLSVAEIEKSGSFTEVKNTTVLPDCHL